MNDIFFFAVGLILLGIGLLMLTAKVMAYIRCTVPIHATVVNLEKEYTHLRGVRYTHNSPFDESCLKAAFQMYQMDYPDYQFFCTCRASRNKLGSRLPNHQLQTVAAYCGYDLTQHHNALADAEACAWIARELL